MATKIPPAFGPGGMAIEGNVLKVRQDLRWEDYHPFERVCRELLQAKEDEVVVDLSAAGHMFSTVIGILAATAVEARQKNKRLVLRIPEGLGWVARTSGLDQLLSVERAD